MSQQLLEQLDKKGVVTLTLNRPSVHNAFNDQLISELANRLEELDRDPSVRIIILTGAGKSFSSGADLNWMKRMATYSEEENMEDAFNLAELMYILDTLRKPTIARVNGPTFGGGVGLVACCDIAIASDQAKFSLSEVRLGLVPAVISPYVVRAIGPRHARRYFQTAELIDSSTAATIGLVHEAVVDNCLDEAVDHQVEMLLKGGPNALKACKDLIASETRSGETAAESLKRMTAELIAQLRVSDEGQEGLSAFLEKRRPAWNE